MELLSEAIYHCAERSFMTVSCCLLHEHGLMIIIFYCGYKINVVTAKLQRILEVLLKGLHVYIRIV